MRNAGYKNGDHLRGGVEPPKPMHVCWMADGHIDENATETIRKAYARLSRTTFTLRAYVHPQRSDTL